MNSQNSLTPNQEKALHFIHDAAEESGTPPTLRELCDHMNYSAIGSAQDLIASLRKKGFLEQPTQRAARSLFLTDKALHTLGISKGSKDVLHVPCLGAVPAGNPAEAIESIVSTIRLDTSLVPKGLRRNRKLLYGLRATGDSMVGAGILDGDWLVVRFQEEAEANQIVVARTGQDATVKRLMRDKKGWYLQPENSNYQPIYACDQEFVVVGRVVALQRAVD